MPRMYREGPLPHPTRSFPNWSTAPPTSTLANGTSRSPRRSRSSHTIPHDSPETSTPASPFLPLPPWCDAELNPGSSGQPSSPGFPGPPLPKPALQAQRLKGRPPPPRARRAKLLTTTLGLRVAITKPAEAPVESSLRKKPAQGRGGGGGGSVGGGAGGKDERFAERSFQQLSPQLRAEQKVPPPAPRPAPEVPPTRLPRAPCACPSAGFHVHEVALRMFLRKK